MTFLEVLDKHFVGLAITLIIIVIVLADAFSRRK